MTATELRAKLGEILDAASAGERILIERDHRPLAFLMSFEDGRLLDGSNEDRRKRRLEALDRIQSFAAEMQAKGSRDPKAPDAVTAVRLDRDRDEPGRSES